MPFLYSKFLPLKKNIKYKTINLYKNITNCKLFLL